MTDDPGQEILSRLLQENADLEAGIENWHLTGRMIGTVYHGMAREGVPEDAAIALTTEWMECHLFDRLERWSGPAILDEDLDEDASEEREDDE